jgi:hypothetical protein
MSLATYRTCSWREKRKVLEVFWRRDVGASSRLLEAAREYGVWAVMCCLAIALEPIPVIVVSFQHDSAFGWLAVAFELFALWSAWWSVVRLVELRRPRELPARAS